MEALQQFARETWAVMLELSPSLWLGLLLAGLLHVFLPSGLIRRRLAGDDMRSVLGAVLVGVPMPLCSCGVVPTAIGLRNDGASKGAATGFLIATPQTGVDSVLVSASFLGWPFALFKVAAAFVTGLLGGGLVNAATRGDRPAAPPSLQPIGAMTGRGRLVEAGRYAVFDLLAMIDIWIVAGVLVSALIALLLPAGSLTDVAWLQGIGGMLVVLLVALPLYVCTTGSVPIAASLIAAGMPLGSALVFLMAGPATNVATLGAVYRSLGGRVLAIYLGVVALMSVLLGWLFDFVLGGAAAGAVAAGHVHGHAWWQQLLAGAMALALVGLLLRRLVLARRARRRAATPDGGTAPGELVLPVAGMNCGHCVANVKHALESAPGVESAEPDLQLGQVRIAGQDLDRDRLATVIERAGYRVPG